MKKENIIEFINNSKQFEQLVLSNTYKDGMHTIEALFHNLDNTFNYSIDRVETSQIIQVENFKGLKNINEVMGVVK